MYYCHFSIEYITSIESFKALLDYFSLEGHIILRIFGYSTAWVKKWRRDQAIREENEEQTKYIRNIEELNMQMEVLKVRDNDTRKIDQIVQLYWERE